MSILLLFLLLAFPYLHECEAIGRQRFRQRPASVVVVEGEDVLLRCEVEDQKGRAQWTKDGFALGFERDLPGYPRFSYMGRPALGQHHLLISDVTITEDGEYQCQVTPGGSTEPLWAAANVTVLVPPKLVEIIEHSDGEEVEVSDGDSLTLECLVKDARPAPKTTWLRDGASLSEGLVHEVVHKSLLPRLWSVKSRLVLPVTAKDDGRVMFCQAIHPALIETANPLQAEVTLSVRHPPGQPSILGYQDDEVLVAGQRIELQCRVSEGNPRPALTWWRHPRPSKRGSSMPTTPALANTTSSTSTITTTARTTTSRLQFIVAAEDDGAEYECRAESELLQRPLVTSVRLSVYYAPSSVSVSSPREVMIGAAISLTCETSESNPPAVLTWRVDGSEVRPTREIMSEVSTGGWATSSELVHKIPKATPATQLKVECVVVNPAVARPRSKTVFISIIKPAGPPEFEGVPGRDVLAGASLGVICVSRGGHPPPEIRMYKVRHPITTVVTTEGSVTRATANLQVIPSDNGSEVTCEVTSSSTSRPMTSSFTLSVLFPPWKVKGWVSPPTVEEGQPVSLSCLSSPSIPPANITWRASRLSFALPQLTHHSPAAFGGVASQSEILVAAAAAEDDRLLVVCEADNGLASPVSTSLMLHVMHAPRWVTKPPPIINVTEGSDLLVRAAAKANPGPVRYIWRRVKKYRNKNAISSVDIDEEIESAEGEKGDGWLSGSMGEKLSMSSVSREDSGHYSVKITSPRGSLSAAFYINVQYGPEGVTAAARREVAAGAAVRLKCSSRGNPSPRLTWSTDPDLPPWPDGSGGGLGNGVGTAWLVVEAARTKDTGCYYCHASSMLGKAKPAVTCLIVQQPAKIVINLDTEKKGGVQESWADMGSNGRLMCLVRAAPPPTFIWSTSHDHILLSGDKYIIQEPQLTDGLVTWVSVLEVNRIHHQDNTSYRCSAHNALGSDSVVMHLKHSNRLPPPLHLSVVNLTIDEVWLIWTPNMNGDTPSGYTVRYRPINDSSYKYQKVEGGLISMVHLQGLVPGKNYTVGVQASSHHGKSNFTSLNVITFPGHDMQPPTNFQGLAESGGSMVTGMRGGLYNQGGGIGTFRLSGFMLLLLVLIGAALLLINFSIIACFLRRRAANAAAAAVAVTSAAEKKSPILESKEGLPGTLNYQSLLSLGALHFPDQQHIPALKPEEKVSIQENGDLASTLASGSLVAVPVTTTVTTMQLSRRNSAIITTSSTLIAFRTTSPRTVSWDGRCDSPGVAHYHYTGTHDSAETRFWAAPSSTAETENSTFYRGLPQGPDICLVSPANCDDASGCLRRPHTPLEDQLSLSSFRSSNVETSSVCSAQGLSRPLSLLKNMEYLKEAPEIVQDAIRSNPQSHNLTRRSHSPDTNCCGSEEPLHTSYSSLSSSGLIKGTHLSKPTCVTASRTGGFTPNAARRLTPTKVACPRPPSRSSDGEAAKSDNSETASTSIASSPCRSKI